MSLDFSRRDFLGAAAFSTGASALHAGQSSRVLGANDRISFGCIGLGARGTWHLTELVRRSEEENVRVVAVCDVFRRRLNRALGISHADGYMDYRKVLERKDVDAVVIATPDHWHAKMALDALDADKHIYLEKPMTLTAEQALEVRDSVRRHKLVMQVGPQWTSDDAFWQANAAIRTGRIGKVTWSQAGFNRNARECLFNAEPFRIDPAVGPNASGENNVDWDMWLGHEFGLTPKIPFTPEHFFRFRKYWAYSGGVATDLLYHRLAPLLLAIAGPNGEYPLRAHCAGGLYIEKDGRDIPDTMLMTIDYPSEHTVLLVSTLTNNTDVPTRIYGKHGTIHMTRSRDLATGGDVELSANGAFRPEFRQRNEGHDGISLALARRRDMMGNFIDVIRGKGTLYCNAELGAATMVAIAMGVDAYRQHKVLTWDAKAEKVVYA